MTVACGTGSIKFMGEAYGTQTCRCKLHCVSSRQHSLSCFYVSTVPRGLYNTKVIYTIIHLKHHPQRAYAKSLHTIYKRHLGRMEKHRISFIPLIVILSFDTQQVHSVKFASKFRHMTHISEIMFLPELWLITLKEAPVSGLTECSMRCYMSWKYAFCLV